MIRPQEDRRLVAQLVMQFLKESEDLTSQGDMMTCLRFESKWRADAQNIDKPLPVCYRYHEARIYEATQLARKVLEMVDNSIK